MKQTICNAIYEAVKKYKPNMDTPWKDLGFKNFKDMLNQIKTNIQVALWALTELEHFSDWESDFVEDLMNDDYYEPIYKINDFTFGVGMSPINGEYTIIPMKKVTKTVVQTFWEKDNSIKM